MHSKREPTHLRVVGKKTPQEDIRKYDEANQKLNPLTLKICDFIKESVTKNTLFRQLANNHSKSPRDIPTINQESTKYLPGVGVQRNNQRLWEMSRK